MTVRAAILGASGYTGADLIRFLLDHPKVSIGALTADRSAGQPAAAVFHHLIAADLPDLIRIEDLNPSDFDVIFCCLPHATTQAVIKELPAGLPVIDLSADFRLRDPVVYEEWYGHPHQALERQGEAVYGLTELYRDQIRASKLIACPGCYPTAALLALQPLVAQALIDPDSIAVTALSGTTGAGRGLKQNLLLAEAGEGVSAYGISRHRHMAELEQELSLAAGRPVVAGFQPHLIPMARGEFITASVRSDHSADDVRAALAARYKDEPFIRILPADQPPHTAHVRGSNMCFLSVVPDRRPGHLLVFAVIDNLIKGSSGQALQNFNVAFGFEETTALPRLAQFP